MRSCGIQMKAVFNWMLMISILDMSLNISDYSHIYQEPTSSELQCKFPIPHDDSIKWKYFPRYWPFVRGIHRSPVNSLHKGQWCGALMFSLICVWINSWVNHHEASDLTWYHGHYDVIVMISFSYYQYSSIQYHKARVANQDIYIWLTLLYCFVINQFQAYLSRLQFNYTCIFYGIYWVQISNYYYDVVVCCNVSMGKCKKDVTPLLMHWSYIFLH